MAIITDEMARMIAELRLCYVATVTPDGRPNLSPKIGRPSQSPRDTSLHPKRPKLLPKPSRLHRNPQFTRLRR